MSCPWADREPACRVHQAEIAFLFHYNSNARAFVTVSVGLLQIYVFCPSPNESLIGSDYVTSNDKGKFPFACNGRHIGEKRCSSTHSWH